MSNQYISKSQQQPEIRNSISNRIESLDKLILQLENDYDEFRAKLGPVIIPVPECLPNNFNKDAEIVQSDLYLKLTNIEQKLLRLNRRLVEDKNNLQV